FFRVDVDTFRSSTIWNQSRGEQRLPARQPQPRKRPHPNGNDTTWPSPVKYRVFNTDPNHPPLNYEASPVLLCPVLPDEVTLSSRRAHFIGGPRPRINLVGDIGNLLVQYAWYVMVST